MDYLWIKAIHLIAVISWMAGILYLPRLFVYHTETNIGDKDYQRFCTMEAKLLKYIMLPSAIISVITGLYLAIIANLFIFGWLHAKLGLILLLIACHIHMIKYAREFAQNRSKRSSKFFRIFNEVPTIIMIVIVILVVVKPF